MKTALIGLLALSAGAALAGPDAGCAISPTGILAPPAQLAVNVPASITLATTGCATPFRLSQLATGSLPPGLTFTPTPNGAVISGTPTTAGVYAFTLRLMDFNYKLPTESVIIQVNIPLQIDTLAVATDAPGQAYTERIFARGGVAPYTFSIVAGALPTGLTLNPTTGVISGTMPAVGSQFRVRVTDSASPAVFVEQPYTIFATGRITTVTAPPVASVGTPYTFPISSSLGTGGLSPGLGTLPPGLAVDPNGNISGIPTAPGNYNITVRQTIGSNSVWRSFRILVNSTGSITGTPRTAEELAPYNHVFTANGGAPPYSFAVTAGALPAGLVLNAATGAVTGTLNLGAVGSPFTLTATDASARTYSQTFSIPTVVRLLGTTSTPPTVRVNQSGSATPYVLSSGGSIKQFSTVLGGVGAQLVFVDPVTGATTYSFPSPGVFTPIILGTDDLGGTVLFNTVAYTCVGTLGIADLELPNGREGIPYSAGISVLNGNFTPLTFAVTSGTLWPGLSLNPATGVISGTPQVGAGGGSFTATIAVSDNASQVASRSYTVGIGTTIQITSTAVPAGTTGVPYSTTLTQTGATGPSWLSLSPSALPPGITLSPTGVLSGTPTLSGTYTFSVQLSHAATSATDTKQFTINVSAPLSATIAPPSPLEATVASSLTAIVNTVGGRAPFTLSLSGGTLPDGLFLLNGASIGISGVPMVATIASMTINVTDADGRTTSVPYTINVRDNVQILTLTLAVPTRTVAYSQALSATYGSTPYVWSLSSGSMPQGLTVSSGGVISGTPTTNGTFNFSILVTDAFGRGTEQNYVLDVADPLAITNTLPLPSGQQQVNYSTTITTTGGSSSKTFSIIAGNLPPLLGINPTSGVISIFPAISGVYSFTVQAQDSQGRVATLAAQITILGSVVIAPASLPNGAVGVSYSQQLSGIGSIGAVSWSVSSGALPGGLTLAPSTGVISGAPTSAGVFTFTASALDSLSQTGTRAYSIQVLNSLSISPTSIPNGTVGAAYSQQLAAGGATGSVSWTISAGVLPNGLTLAPSTGLISGTPSAPGTFGFTVTAQDSLSQTGSRSYTGQILSTLSVTPASLSNATLGSAYSQQLTASVAVGAVVWSISTGTLPGGLTLNSSSGLLNGTPTSAGTFAFTVSATDSQGQTGARAYTLLVLRVLSISPTSLPGSNVGAAYAQSLTATGATGAVNWTVSAGALPTGLTLGPATGIISGVPAAIGAFSFAVTATDSLTQTGSQSYAVTIAGGITALPDGTETEPYATTLVASGPSSAVTWALAAGTLPPGLSLTPATGVIAGTPTAFGSYTFTVQANVVGGPSTTQLLSVFVFQKLSIPPYVPGDITQNVRYAFALGATGGRGPFTWAISGSTLPVGFILNPSTGLISGTTSSTDGAYPQNVSVTDSRGRTAQRVIVFTIAAPPPPALTLSPDTLPAGAVGQPYRVDFSGSGGTPGYTFSLSFSQVPPGLNFINGVLSGTPTRVGVFPFAINMADSAGRSTGILYRLVVDPAPIPLAVTPATIVPTVQIGTPLILQFGATGGNGPYTFSISGTLPPGTSSNSSGLLSGTPSQSGPFTINVQVTDAAGTKATQSYALTVTGTLTVTTTPPLAEGTVGKPFSVTFAVSGGLGPYAWTATDTTPPGLALNAATGTLSGTPTVPGTYTFTVSVQDSQKLNASSSFSITIYPPVTISAPTRTTPFVTGTSGSASTPAIGGKGPLTYSISDGALPPGMSLDSKTGDITGTPTEPGTYTFTVRATDLLGNVASVGVTFVVLPPLTVSTLSLPAGTVGVTYTAELAASGGLPPLGAWNIAAGSLPAGLSLAVNGAITGVPTDVGTATFTVRITDATGTAATRVLSILIVLPPLSQVTVTGLPQLLPPGAQTTIGVSLAQPFPIAVTGTLTLLFEPAAVNNANDPSVQFSSGGRIVTFTIPAGQTQGVFPVNPLRLLSGTVAGTIRIQTVTSPASATPIPDATVPAARNIPVIVSGSVLLGTGTFTLTLDGFTNTREVSAGTFRLVPVAGSSLGATDIPVSIATFFTSYFQSAASGPFGGQFRLAIPFTVSGALSDIDSVVVTLTNAAGTSAPFTVRMR